MFEKSVGDHLCVPIADCRASHGSISSFDTIA